MGEWRIEALGNLGFTYTGLSGKGAADFGHGTPYIPYLNVFNNAKVDADQLEYVSIEPHERQNAVNKGDVIFTTSSETPEEVGMSSVLTKDIGTVYLNSFCFGWRLKKLEMFNSEFLAYALRSQNIRHQMLIAAQGSTRHNLSKKNFNRIYMKYPVSTAEQSGIAEVLSGADEAIKKTHALIEKYRNIKEGLIQAVLTNGVDDQGRIRSPETHEYKDSPIGQIPVEWEAVTIGDITSKVGSGATPRGGQAVYEREGVLFLRSQNIAFEGLLLDDVAFINGQIHAQMRRSWVEKYDVLLNITGASLGRCSLYKLDQPANVNQHVCIIRTTHSPEYAKYVHYWLCSFGQKQINLLMAGGNREGLNFGQIKHIKLPRIDDTDELHRIMAILNTADEKIQTEQAYLIKLRDIKQGLMQDLLNNAVSVDTLLKEGGE